MEKKRWVFIFFALCLALALTSSPVEAADECDTPDGVWDGIAPDRCDRDGDCYVKDNKSCLRSNPEAAEFPDCDDSAASDDNSCVDVDGGGATFLIEVLEGADPDAGSNWVETIDCVGTTSVNLSSHFPIGVGCGQVTIDDGRLTLYLSQMSVRNTKFRMTAHFFFSEVCCPPHTDNAFVYSTDDLPVTLGTTDVEGASFQINVDAHDVDVEKIHWPLKGRLVGSLSIGTIIYTPAIE